LKPQNFRKSLSVCWDLLEVGFVITIVFSLLYARLMIGSALRAECRETKKFECEAKDPADDLLARRTLNRVI
jgi:hypothetical protein